MKKNIITKLFIVAILSITMFSCYEQEVAEVIDASKYTTAQLTVEGDFNGTTVQEGDKVTFDVTFDKAMEPDIQFEVIQSDGDAEVDVDYEFTGGLVNGYYTNAKLTIDFPSDMLVEPSKSMNFMVGVPGLGQKYLLSPQTQYPEYTIEIKNVNDPSGLTINVEWDNHDDDWDVMIIDQGGTDEWTGWAGATGANPELTLLGNDVPDDTYYVEMDDWHVENDLVQFTINIGHPDQSIESFSFTWDEAESDDYPANWGYQLVKIVKVGDTYTCSLVQ